MKNTSFEAGGILQSSASSKTKVRFANTCVFYMKYDLALTLRDFPHTDGADVGVMVTDGVMVRLKLDFCGP